MAEAPEVDEPAGPDGRRSLLARVGAAGEAAASLGGESSPWRRRSLIAIGLLAVAFVGYTVAQNWSRLPSIEWRFHAGWLALSVLALASFQALQAHVWTLMVRTLGSPVPTAPAWSIWSVTLLARYVPSNLGMIVGRTAMGEREGIPKRVTFASIIYQLGATMAGAAAVGAYFAVQLPALADQPLRWAALAVPVLAVVAMDPLVFPRLADVALRKLGSEPLPMAMPRGAVLAYSLLAAVSFVVVGVAVWAFAEAIHGLAPSEVPVAIGSYSLGYALSVLTLFLPGGLGAREAAMVAALQAVMPVAVAVAVAVGIRLAQVAVEIAFATLTPVWARRSRAAAASP